MSASLLLPGGQHTFGLTGVEAFNDYYDVILSGGISGAGGLDLASGRFTLTTASTYTGATNVNGGTLYLTATNALPTSTALTVNGKLVLGTSTQNGDGPSGGDPITATTVTQTLGSLSGSGKINIDAGNTLTLAQGAADGTFSGFIQGDGLLVKQGTGTLTLLNTTPNSVRIESGRLVVGNVAGANFEDDGILDLGGASTNSYGSVGTITGTGSVVKRGSQEIVVSGRSTYTGGTTVKAGQLDASYPTGDYVDDSRLGLYVAEDLDYSGAITGTGALLTGSSSSVSGQRTLTLSGDNAYSGGTTIGLGTLRVGSDHALGQGGGNVAITGGTLDINGHAASIGDLTLGDGASFGNPGAVTGAGSLGLAGNVTLNVPPQQGGQFGRPATIGANVVLSAGQHAIGSSGHITDRSGTGDDLTFSGVLSGPGGLAVANGNLTVGLSGHSTYVGPTEIRQGELDLLTTDALPTTTALAVGTQGLGVLGVLHSQTVGAFSGGAAGDLEFLNGATLTVGDATDTTYAGTFGQGGATSGALVKRGAGTLTFTGFTNYTGGTTVQGGRLVVAHPVGSFLDNATLEFATATALTYATPITGTGAFAKSGAGTLTLTGAETYAGGTTVSAGRLQIGSGGNVGGGLTVAPGATFANASGAVLTLGAGALNGTVDTDASSYTVFRGFATGAGSFTGKGLVELDGGYSPGAPLASVSFGGDLALGLRGDLTMELGGTTLGTGYDHLNVAGTAYLGGTLDVVYANGFTAQAGQSFDLFDFGRTFDRFSLVDLPTLGSGLSWDVSALYTTGVIRVVPQAVPEPAAWAVLGIGALGLLRRRRV